MFHPKMIIYERNFDENKRIYFLKLFIEYMEILETVSNIIEI